MARETSGVSYCANKRRALIAAFTACLGAEMLAVSPDTNAQTDIEKSNPDAARLMGINVHRTVAVSFMISTALAGLAGLLIAPLFSVSSEMGTLFGIKAFAVAILGGMGSAWGVVIAGLAYGLIEALVTAFLGSVYTQIVVFSVVILALALMPNGLFGRAAINKV